MLPLHALVSVGLFAQLGAVVPTDSLERLREHARDAEARYERLSRQLAPLSWSGPSGVCDEVVGRFCLRFDSAARRPGAVGAEPDRSTNARREAVEALRRYFAAAPQDYAAAGPLIRLLVRDGRAREAASAAGVYAALSGDTLRSHLLHGFALHHAGDGEAAERHFAAALARMTPDEQREWLDPSWLVHPDEARALGRMSPEERHEYERRFWLLADPFWTTPANERWNEHLARHVEARLLAEAPSGAGSFRWGRDLDQLTVRYGTPVERARQADYGAAARPVMIEYWDTAQRAYVLPSISRGLPAQPAPGVRPHLYAATARSAYALRTVTRVLEPAHQVSRFRRGGAVVLRVDAAVSLGVDSVAGISPGDGMHAALIVYDSALTRRVAVDANPRVGADSVRWTGFVEAWPGRLIYSIEIKGDSSRPGARARYAISGRLEQPSMPDAIVPDGLLMSDLLVTHPEVAGDDSRDMTVAALQQPGSGADGRDPPVRRRPDAVVDVPAMPAFESLIFEPGDTVGLYAEVYGLSPGVHAAFEVSVESAETPSLLGRLAGWIGRSLGLLRVRDQPRIGWRGEEAAERRYEVAFNVLLPNDRYGLHDLVLRVTDPATGDSRVARRRILLRR